MRASRPVLLTLLLHGCLAGACSGEPMKADPNRPPAPPAPAGARVIDFEGMAVGAPPEGFTLARTGKGGPGRWEVVAVDGAPSGGKALAQTSTDTTGYRFPLAVVEGFTARDVDLAVRFRPVSGAVDRAAGLVWRYRDANNYYIVRANALEDNVVLYKVEDGKRTDLDVKGAGRTYGVKAEVPKDAWSELRVIARGSLFTVYLNGQELFQVEDGTFREAGRVGLWTKADSVTRFDDLRFAGLDGG
ncbi:MAG TPA: family 16 glycoside hydrolase [Thermoanaerobaculia bacterium]|nr:family 16 glycoside hydrolase [Thermoanaerobaculia bacterium]